jgi:hypothetical protein
MELDAMLAQQVLLQEILLAERLRGRGFIDRWIAHLVDHQDQEVRPPPSERLGGRTRGYRRGPLGRMALEEPENAGSSEATPLEETPARKRGGGDGFR